MAENPEIEAALKGLTQDGNPEIKETTEKTEINDPDGKINRAIVTKIENVKYKDNEGKPAKVKITTTITTTDTFPDGSSRSKVEGNIVLKDLKTSNPNNEIDKALEGFKPSGAAKESKETKTEQVNENGNNIERKTTTTTIVQDYTNDKNKKRTKTVVKTEVEDKRPDGSKSIQRSEEVSLADS